MIVIQASSPIAQALIPKHLALHAWLASTQIFLVPTRPHTAFLAHPGPSWIEQARKVILPARAVRKVSFRQKSPGSRKMFAKTALLVSSRIWWELPLHSRAGTAGLVRTPPCLEPSRMQHANTVFRANSRRRQVVLVPKSVKIVPPANSLQNQQLLTTQIASSVQREHTQALLGSILSKAVHVVRREVTRTQQEQLQVHFAYPAPQGHIQRCLAEKREMFA